MAEILLANYEQFVVVAETEWKFDSLLLTATAGSACSCGHGQYFYNYSSCSRCGRNIQTTTNPRIPNKQAMRLGTIEWNIVFNEQTNKKLEFSCQTVDDGAINEVHMELVHYCRSKPNECYGKKNVLRHIFSSTTNSLFWDLNSRDNSFTVRILKDRPAFPDFTLEHKDVGGRWASDLKLLVGDKVFHVNKQLLTMHSDYFDRMFNSKFKEANQEEIELKHEPMDPAIFHDFLLVMSVTEALPNPNNVAALAALANNYQVDVVRIKCQRHLTMCHELAVEQRYVLALENGNEELQTSIRRNMNLEEADRIVAAVSKKAVAL